MQKTVPQVEDPVMQKLHHEQAERMLLASFMSGLLGTPGRQVRSAMPRIMDEALKIAITTNQAEIQEWHNEAIYKDEVCGSSIADRPSHAMRCDGTVRNNPAHRSRLHTEVSTANDLLEIQGTEKTGNVMSVEV